MILTVIVEVIQILEKLRADIYEAVSQQNSIDMSFLHLKLFSSLCAKRKQE